MTEATIFTTRGNVPVADLDYSPYWDDQIEVKASIAVDQGDVKLIPEKAGYIVFIDRYFYKGTDEVAHESRHVHKFDKLDMSQQQGGF